MMQQKRWRTPRKCLLLLAAAALLAAVPQARAEDKKPDASLALIPADAAYYSAMLRNREQLDAVAKSKAWARITQLPTFQLAWGIVQSQYTGDEGKLAPLREWVEQPDNRELIDVLAEAVSDEIFFYGDATCTDFSHLYAQVNMARYLGPAEEIIRNPKILQNKQELNQAMSQAQVRAVLRVLARNPDKVRIPDFVIGFKIASPKKAEAQLKRLEALLEAVAAQQPILQGRVKRVKLGTGNYLTLNLDGSMVPWDPGAITDLAEAAGEFDGVVKKLKELKLTFSLGVRDNFLLFAIGSSADVLGKLGGSTERLTTRPELKPLVRVADNRLTGISYTSKALNASSQMNQKDIDRLALLARQGLEAAGVPEERRKAIEKDVIDLAGEMKKGMPDPGAALAFAFLSERGYESYDYQHGQFPDRDGSKALTLLNHVGGDPILAVVGRSRGALEQYRSLSKWVRKAYGHVEPLIVEKLDKDQREQYEKGRDAFMPLLKRLDKATSEMLLPALADGQAGFVLDAKWKSKQWHKDMPASDKALPMLELGVIVGVSDADLLEKAMKSYTKIVEDALAKAREMAPPGEVPPIKIPGPEVKTVKAGKLYLYPLPSEWKLDAQVAPTAGLSARVGVLALSAGHAERLLESKPLQIDGGPLSDAKRPLAGASYFRWPAFVDAVTPWILFGLEQGHAEKLLPGAGDEKMAREQLFKQVRTVLDVLKVFRVSTSATYVEDGVLITHSETVVRDE